MKTFGICVKESYSALSLYIESLNGSITFLIWVANAVWLIMGTVHRSRGRGKLAACNGCDDEELSREVY